MRREEVENLLHAQPFQPFVMRMPDGRELPIRHPEFASVAPSGRIAIVYRADDRFSVVDLALVSDLEVGTREPPGSPEQN